MSTTYKCPRGHRFIAPSGRVPAPPCPTCAAFVVGGLVSVEVSAHGSYPVDDYVARVVRMTTTTVRLAPLPTLAGDHPPRSVPWSRVLTAERVTS